MLFFMFHFCTFEINEDPLITIVLKTCQVAPSFSCFRVEWLTARRNHFHASNFFLREKSWFLVRLQIFVKVCSKTNSSFIPYWTFFAVTNTLKMGRFEKVSLRECFTAEMKVCLGLARRQVFDVKIFRSDHTV